jgi:Fe-S cluster assembly protein SufB
MRQQLQKSEKTRYSIATEDAIGLIVNGYAHEVINKLPMEFAVEAQKLLQISLEGSVG